MILCCCSATKSCLTLWPHGLQHFRLPCSSLSPRVCSNSCPLSWWCHPPISSSVVPFSCLQSFPASGSFPVSQFCTSGGQSIEVAAVTSVFKILQWLPILLTGKAEVLLYMGCFRGILKFYLSTPIWPPCSLNISSMLWPQGLCTSYPFSWWK